MRGVFANIVGSLAGIAAGLLCQYVLLFCVIALGYGLRTTHAETADTSSLDAIALTAIDVYHTIEASRDLDADAESTDAGTLAWSDSHVLKASLSMYEATGDLDSFIRVRNHAVSIFAHRGDRIGLMDEVRGRVLPAWIATPRHGLGPHAWIVHQGMIAQPLARWIYLVHHDPVLRVQYGQEANAYLRDLIEMTTAFEDEVHDGPAAGEQYYDFRYMRDDPDEPMPFNQQNALGRAFVQLWLITGDERFRARATGLAHFFKNRLVSRRASYVWRYATYYPPDTAEDISHGSINVDFAYQCWRAGIVFDTSDMLKFAGTLQYIYAGAPVWFDDYVNGNDDPDANHAPTAGHWMHLGSVSPNVRPLYFQYFEALQPAVGSSFLLGAAYLAETACPIVFESALGLVTGDADTDGDVDLADFSGFQFCFNGPNRPTPATGCTMYDADWDNDVDLADFTRFAACFNGPNRAPACD